MLQFAANLSLMYTDLPFLDRFEAAARDGFCGVEFLFPYAWDAHEILVRLDANGLQQVLFNTPAAGWDAASADSLWQQGQRGTASVPGREEEFRAGVALALRYAQALSCPRIHLMAGLLPAGARFHDHLTTFQRNLEWAAQQAAAAGCEVLIEPINTRDIPGYFLNRQADAHQVVQAVGSPNLKVQMDLYHRQIVEGDVAHKIVHYLPTGRIGHFQIAGVPERHEPDIGELNYPYLFQLIDTLSSQCHWQGWIGCEYRPRRGAQTGGTSAGLDWLRALPSSVYTRLNQRA